MGTKANESVVRGVVRALNNREWDTLASLYGDSAVLCHTAMPAPLVGGRKIVGYVRGLIDMWPDLRVDVDRLFGSGAWMCLEVTASWTHRPQSQVGSSPAQRLVRYPECVIFRVENGHVEEERHYVDRMTITEQQGAPPDA